MKTAHQLFESVIAMARRIALTQVSSSDKCNKGFGPKIKISFFSPSLKFSLVFSLVKLKF